MRTLRYASLGFLLGVTWGVAARVWMRLITTAPEFSWSGTLIIIVGASIAGLALGVIHAARRRGASQWWRLLGLLVVLFLSQAQGPLLLPAVLLGGWGLRRGALGRVVAGVGILSAPVLPLLLSWELVDTHLMPYPDTVYRLVLAAGGLLLSSTAAWASSIALGPWRRGRTTLEPNEALAVAA